MSEKFPEQIVSWVAIGLMFFVISLAFYGCASPPTNSVIVQCIPLKSDWTNDDQDQLRKEYDVLPSHAKMRLAFMDYMAMRDADKTCLRGASQ